MNAKPNAQRLTQPAEAQQACRTRVRYCVLTAVCSLGLIAYIHRMAFASAGTRLKSEFGISDSDWGQVMAAFLVAYALFEVPWGVVGDRWGTRHLLTMIVLGWSALTALVAAVTESHTFVYLLTIRFLFGAFQAGAFPAISRIMADWMPIPERATAQGLIWMCSRLGGAVAPFLMGSLIYQTAGWRTAFVSVSLVGVIWAFCFWPWFRNRPEDMKQVGALELQLIVGGRGQIRTAHGRIPWSSMRRSRSVWFLCAMYGFCGFSATFFITMLPAYLKEHRGLAPSDEQLLSSLPLACGVFACGLGGFISDHIIRTTGNRRWGRRLCGLVGHACAGFALFCVNYVEATWALAALLSMTFFFNDLAMGPAWAACADIGERYAGTLGGTMNMVGNLGAALGTLVAGSLFGKTFILYSGVHETVTVLGNNLVFFVFACSFWLASLCWLGIDVTCPIRVDSHESATDGSSK